MPSPVATRLTQSSPRLSTVTSPPPRSSYSPGGPGHSGGAGGADALSGHEAVAVAEDGLEDPLECVDHVGHAGAAAVGVDPFGPAGGVHADGAGGPGAA